MKLNAEIIFDGLNPDLGATISGNADDRLLLERPQLLGSDATRLESNHVYIASGDRLPRRPRIGDNVLLVCVGSSSHSAYYQERCCIITVNAVAGLTRTFNEIQRIYDLLDSWNDKLLMLLADDADVASMLEISTGVLDNPMFVLDANFRYVALAGYDGLETPPMGFDGALDMDEFSQFLKEYDLSMYTPGPIIMSFEGNESLNVNLLDRGTYFGCLSIHPGRRPFKNSDKALASHLSRLLLEAMKRITSMSSGSEIMRNALEDLVDGTLPDRAARAELERSSATGSFICLRLRVSDRFAHTPAEYVRDKVESAFPRCWGFQRHRSSIVAFADISTMREDDIGAVLGTILDTIDSHMGISDEFTDLLDAKAYSAEARIALESGFATNPDKRIHTFKEHALGELLANAPGELPPERFYPQGLRDLLNYNSKSQADYIETLRCYLDNSLSATSTARELYLHRSSFLERLRHIRRFVGAELDSPEGRLLLQISLRLMER